MSEGTGRSRSRSRTRRVTRLLAASLGAVSLVVPLAASPAAARPKVGTITQYQVPPPASAPGAAIPSITIGPDGNLWFGSHIGAGPGATDAYLVRMNLPSTPSQGVSFDSRVLPKSEPFPLRPEGLTRHAHDVESGPDGNLWVTTPHVRPGPTGKPSEITVFDTDFNVIGAYAIQAPAMAGVFIPTMGLTQGPDGRMWGLDARFQRVFVIDPSVAPDPDLLVNSGNAVVGLERLPAELRQPGDYDAGDIFDLNPQTEPDVLPGEATYAGIVAGPDGNLWIQARQTGNETQGYMLRMTTAGVVTGQFAIPRQTDSRPGRLTVGPDGALWFTQPNDGQVGRITTDGVVTEYDLPAGSRPHGITTGGDGALWFTSSDSPATNFLSYVGRLHPATGEITTFPLEADATADDITLGPDGNLYFAKRGRGQIGMVVGGKFVLTATLRRFGDQPNTGEAVGEATLRIGPGGSLCYRVRARGLTPLTDVHIHSHAGHGTVPFPATPVTEPNGTQVLRGCTPTPLAADIIANPANYYVGVHTADPTQPVRGQFGVAP